jgi:hypothetical protein
METKLKIHRGVDVVVVWGVDQGVPVEPRHASAKVTLDT